MRFRKLPVEIEAHPFLGLPFTDEILKFLVQSPFGYDVSADGELIINTLEGAMLAQKGDWVIKGVAGEFYPCKPDIFAATYEPAE